MKKPLFFLVFALLLVFVYFSWNKWNFSKEVSFVSIAIHEDSTLAKEESKSLVSLFKTSGISKSNISLNPSKSNYDINIFLDQKKFDECLKNDKDSLKIAIRLNDSFENRENNNVVGVFEKDKYVFLIDFIQKISPSLKKLLVLHDNNIANKNYLKTIIDYSSVKGINVEVVCLDKKNNVSTILKGFSNSIDAVILISGDYILSESEIILEHFKNVKIPVFANNFYLIKSGAFAGFDYDSQEIFNSIANLINIYVESNKKTINDDLLESLSYQLHINMDSMRHLNLKVDDGLLDEAITVSGSDL